ncbi:hypothetical protein NITHO_1010014 [Nitrolancea hollandica Lb]|uniref:Uncharacterized protein n=1 Tax=Nitrolancea hollandica Lb TaxID=1129897 RepID=I4ECA6_9BACT|nr:hypothetical protein NITHO_1010014 [Nitrolancea hollandica Lb]
MISAAFSSVLPQPNPTDVVMAVVLSNAGDATFRGILVTRTCRAHSPYIGRARHGS